MAYAVFQMDNRIVQIADWLIVANPKGWNTNANIQGALIIDEIVEKTKGKGDWIIPEITENQAKSLYDFFQQREVPVVPSLHFMECLEEMTNKQADGIVSLKDYMRKDNE